MLPVVANLIAIHETHMTGDARVLGIDLNPIQVEMRAHHLVRELAGHGITITLHADQARARHPGQHFDVAVERAHHGHEVGLLMFQHIGNGELGIFGVW